LNNEKRRKEDEQALHDSLERSHRGHLPPLFVFLMDEI
jgi:hypothetical protein